MQSVQSLRRARLTFLLVALVIGMFFRFYHLEHKVFWGDEVFTAMRSVGYAAAEVTDRLYTGQVLSLADLQQYQRLSADGRRPIGDHRGLGDTLSALEGSPEHAPLYYLLVRLWLQAAGQSSADVSPTALAQSVWAIRSLSAIVSLLVFPCAYWLCLELFHSSLTGWIAMAILAVSPFHVLYAQEARGYSLWTVTIMLSSAALLRGMQRRSTVSWGIYALTVALGLYSFLFSGLVTIAHAIYVVICADRKTMKAALVAMLAGIGLFAPWLAVMFSHAEQFRSNVAHLDQGQPVLVSLWLLNLSRVFFDFNHGNSWVNPLIYGTLLLSGVAVYSLCRHQPKSIWLFVLSLIGVMGMGLILGDLILGGQRSGIARYPIPCYLGIQIAVAAYFAQRIDQKRWRLALGGLLLTGILSCAVSSQAMLWWNKGLFKSRYNPQAAELVAQSRSPLVISDSSIERVLAFSYLLPPNVQFQLVQAGVPRIPDDRDVFLYQPSIALKNKLERRQNYQFTAEYDGWIWRGIPREGNPNRG